jgi:hypothetical protein
MTFNLFFGKFDHTVGAVVNAETTLDTDHRFVSFAVPVNSTYDAGLGAAAAPDTFLFVKADATAFLHNKSVRGTGPGARGILTRPADHYHESPFHTAVGSNTDARLCQARFVQPSRTGEHTALATDATLLINHRKFFHVTLSSKISLLNFH